MLIADENSSFSGPALARTNRGVDNVRVIGRVLGYKTISNRKMSY